MLIERRRDEQSTYQTKEIESKETKDGEMNRLEQPDRNNTNNYKPACRHCGQEFPHKGTCLARGKTCNKCGKLNHFATVCRGQKQNSMRLPRTRPHNSTSVPPSELLFNRKVRGTLPVICKNIVVNRHKEARENENKRQEYNKSYINNRRNTKRSNISVGNWVLVRQPKQNKLTPHFNQKPYRVIHRNKTVMKARSEDGHEIERNISQKILKQDGDHLNDYHNNTTDQNATNARTTGRRNEDPVRRSTRPEEYHKDMDKLYRQI